MLHGVIPARGMNFPPVLQHGRKALTRQQPGQRERAKRAPPLRMGGSRGELGLLSFGTSGLADASHLRGVKGHDQAKPANCGDVVVKRFDVGEVARCLPVSKHAGRGVRSEHGALTWAVAHERSALEAMIKVTALAVHVQHTGAGLHELAALHA